MEAEGVDLLFLAPSADLEYLTGVERQIPNFGEASYAHGWVTGAFFRPGRDPVFFFPRMFAALLLITVTGVALFGLMVGLDRLLLGHWHDSAVKTER